MRKVSVKILSEGRLPIIGGTGPIRTPITITENEYNILKTLGYNVVLVSEQTFSEPNVQPVPESQPIKVEAPKAEAQVEETSEEEAVSDEQAPAEQQTEETAVEESEEVVSGEEQQEEVVEVLVNDENLSAEAYYTADFLTKKKAIAILEARGVEFDPNENAEPLKQLVLDTNPEVQFEEQ